VQVKLFVAAVQDVPAVETRVRGDVVSPVKVDATPVLVVIVTEAEDALLTTICEFASCAAGITVPAAEPVGILMFNGEVDGNEITMPLPTSAVTGIVTAANVGVPVGLTVMVPPKEPLARPVGVTCTTSEVVVVPVSEPDAPANKFTLAVGRFSKPAVLVGA